MRRGSSQSPPCGVRCPQLHIAEVGGHLRRGALATAAASDPTENISLQGERDDDQRAWLNERQNCCVSDSHSTGALCIGDLLQFLPAARSRIILWLTVAQNFRLFLSP